MSKMFVFCFLKYQISQQFIVSKSLTKRQYHSGIKSRVCSFATNWIKRWYSKQINLNRVKNTTKEKTILAKSGDDFVWELWKGEAMNAHFDPLHCVTTTVGPTAAVGGVRVGDGKGNACGVHATTTSSRPKFPRPNRY